MVISYGYNSSYKSVVLMKLCVIEERESVLGSFQYLERKGDIMMYMETNAERQRVLIKLKYDSSRTQRLPLDF